MACRSFKLLVEAQVCGAASSSLACLAGEQSSGFMQLNTICVDILGTVKCSLGCKLLTTYVSTLC